MLTNSVRRYTSLTNGLVALRTKQLALLDPQTWDDQNDAHFMFQYKEKTGIPAVRAACFSRSPETYHHWNIFAGREGVCLEIERKPLERAIAAMPGGRSGEVKYLTLQKLRRKGKLRAHDLPFLKRQGYKPEAEFRLICSCAENDSVAYLGIDLSWIRRVVLSPWLHESIVKSLKTVIRSQPDCRGLKVYRSSLISNETWMAAGDDAIA